jgi:hypothetical protein
MIPVSPGSGLILRIAPTNGQSTAQTVGARASVTTAADRPIADVAALSMFALGFENGDHKFKRLQVLAEGASARFALNDADDGDPFSARARWVNIVGGAAGTVSGLSGGAVIGQLPIPRGPANHTFVLRGFEFRRAAATDANIRALSINLAASGDAIEVVLSDDERADLRRIRLNAGRTGPDIGRRYNVTVQYAWVPNSAISGSGIITGSERGRDAASIPAGLAAIRGFSYRFDNSDHHILAIEAETADGGSARFQDNNLDDPMRWQIDYVSLRN